MQEGVGGDLDREPFAVARDRRAARCAGSAISPGTPTERNALKSCSPHERRGRLRACARHRAGGGPTWPALAQRRPRGAIEDEIAVGARLSRVAGVKMRRDGPHPGNADVAGSSVFAPSIQPRMLRLASVSKCATCPRACTPASVRPAQTRLTGSSATGESAFGEHLHVSRRALGLPAGVAPCPRTSVRRSECRRQP